jgi:Protein of unknown function (DUF4239)
LTRRRPTGEGDGPAALNLCDMNAWLVGALVIGAAILYSLIGVIAVRALMRGRVLEGHNDVLSPVFATAGVIYAVLLGFVVIAVWETYGNAKDNVQSEATNLTTLYRLTAGMRHPDERIFMRKAIREYTEAVISDEWKTQAATGSASPKTRASMGAMFTEFSRMPLSTTGSQINGEFLRTLSTIVEERNRRIVQASEELPWAMWLGLIIGGAITVGMTFILYMERTWPHVVISSVLAALIGTLLYITIIFNKPFVGPVALESGPFEYAINLYDSVDKGS